MRLFRTIASAQGGRVFANMGAAFGISDELAAQSVRYFLPPIIRSVTRQTETSQGLLQFLDFLGERRFDRFMDDPSIFGHPQVEGHGMAILSALFPRAAQVRKIIANRAKVLPIPPHILEAMFPYVAVMALGAIEQKTRQPLASILERLAQDRVDARSRHNPYTALAREIRRRKLDAKERTGQRSGLSGVLGGLFTRRDERPAASNVKEQMAGVPTRQNLPPGMSPARFG
jgi:hypothetical protein